MPRLICESCDHGYAPNLPICPWCGAASHLAHIAHDVSVYDTECYPNYWSIGFDTGEAFFITPTKPLDAAGLRKTLSRYTLVSFNGISYDVPMMSLALQGFDNAALKAASDAIIVGKQRPWQITRDQLEWIDHIDMIEVAPGQSSLKMYGAKMHSRKLQDLPYDPNTPLTWYQIALLNAYRDNDLSTTRELFDKFVTQRELRDDMSREYGIDLRSKSDAQIAEAVMKSLLPFKVERPHIPPKTSFKYTPPDWMKFQNLDILEYLDRNPFYILPSGSVAPSYYNKVMDWADDALRLDAHNEWVKRPAGWKPSNIQIGSNSYRMGTGGLHSTESQIVNVSDDEYELTDHDVRGYYPSIMIALGLYPAQIGPVFMQHFSSWKIGRDSDKEKAEDASLPNDVRAQYKKKANSKKTLTNGTFGKLLSMWSIFYYPQGGITVTVTGQLSLLMLIEMLEMAGIQVISANTDGIVLKTRRSMAWMRDDIIKWWESTTGFETERTDYIKLASRDVNNYIAVKPDGTVKPKGAFAPPEPGPSGWPNPTGQICVDAIVAYLVRGVPLADTINACNDIRQFVYVRQVKGGGSYLPVELPPKSTTLTNMRRFGGSAAIGVSKDVLRANYAAYRARTLATAEYLGKAVRWYYAVGSQGCIITPAGGLVARTEGCVPLMELPDYMPDDVDREWYVREAISLLADLGINYGL